MDLLIPNLILVNCCTTSGSRDILLHSHIRYYFILVIYITRENLRHYITLRGKHKNIHEPEGRGNIYATEVSNVMIEKILACYVGNFLSRSKHMYLPRLPLGVILVGIFLCYCLKISQLPQEW